VKQKLRAVPNKGLSYGAIKYLAPDSTETNRVKTHRHYNLAFNYLGRFQEMKSDKSMFEPVEDLVVPQKGDKETDYIPGNVSLSHAGDTLLLQVAVPTWLYSSDEVIRLGRSWCEWMNRIVDHCLDTTTIGGRTLSDVPLLGSASVVEDVETELLSGLKLRPLDIEDVYPVTPLQSGLLTAMISDPAEYVLQSVFDIRGDFDFERLETCWKSLALETPLLRTVFVSTVHGLFQAVTNEDLSEWIMLPATWLSDEIDTLTKEYLDNDRQRGFTLMSKSYHRFAAARISDGRIRVFWTHHHSLMDGWSLQLVMDKLLSICYGEEYNATFVPFKDHIEWLAQQDEEPSRLFWESALANSDQSQQLALPKPHLDGQTSQTKYKALALTVPLPGMTSVCRKLGVTPSSVFRAAWSIVLQQYTRSEYVTFGSVVSGRDTGLDGVDKIIGMLINTVPIQVHVSTGGLTDDLIVDVHRLSTDIVQYSHCSLVDVKRWAKVAPEGQLFDTILVYENYPPSEMDKSKLRPFT
ncbi:hypothetical protein As57867_006949, partial [Aphanomyces stellatus]